MRKPLYSHVVVTTLPRAILCVYAAALLLGGSTSTVAQPVVVVSTDRVHFADSTQRTVTVSNEGTLNLSVDSVKFVDSPHVWVFDLVLRDSVWSFQFVQNELYDLANRRLSFDHFPELSLTEGDSLVVKLIDTFCGRCKAFNFVDTLFVFSNDPLARVSKVSIDLTGVVIGAIDDSPETAHDLAAFPNPTSLAITVRVPSRPHALRLRVYDLLGRKKLSVDVPPGPVGQYSELVLDTRELEVGIYLVTTSDLRGESTFFIKI